MLVTALVILGSVFGLLYLYLNKKNEYWAKRGLITPKPVPVLGNYGDFILLKKTLSDTVIDICKQFPKEPIIGTYYGTEPAVIVKDPELLKLIITKDFYYFNSRELAEHKDREPFGKNVFSQSGDTWRVLRQNLTPLFTSAKIKKMFYLIQDRNEDFEKYLAKEIGVKPIHEVRSFMARYTMDCIGSCIFGVESKVMKEETNNPFLTIAEKMFDVGKLVKVVKHNTRSIWPNVVRRLRLTNDNKETFGFFNRLIGGVFTSRNYVPSSRNDFIDFLLAFKQQKQITGDEIKSMKTGHESKDRIKLDVDDELLVAQTIIFFAAGFSTSATTMSTTMFELSKHPKIQKRVQEEVDEYLQKTGGKITFECITDLPYLEACVDEALRIYPVLGVLGREVTEDYRLPSGLVLEKGIRVHVPVHYMHKDPDFFPDPEEYRPERFLAENKNDIKPFTYFPFGDGPRICIGMRFAKMQMMAGLVTLFRHYSVELPPHVSRTVEYDPKAFSMQLKNKIELKFTPRTNVSAH